MSRGIVVIVDATHRPVVFFHLHAGIEDVFIMEDNGVKIFVYNLRNG